MVIAKDIAYVRFAAPDLELAGRFLGDFGFRASARTPTAVYYRGAGSAHHVYILEHGAPEFLGFGLEMHSHEDLIKASEFPGAGKLTALDTPGGGHRVRLNDPDGYRIELVHGTEKVEAAPMREPLPFNYAYQKNRLGKTQRPAAGPAQLKRLGHVGLTVTNLDQTIAWYSETLGMKLTDTVVAGPPGNKVMAFVRCGFPDLFSDHHTLALFKGPKASFGHAAFEVQDFDAIGLGHYHLKRAGWNHAWGIGRHTLGSQLFDYWVDPWGRMIEHFADGDLFDHTRPAETHHAGDTPIELWGPPLIIAGGETPSG